MAKFNASNLNLPKEQQSKLQEFINNQIPATRFLKPDGKPKKEWKIFYGENWNAAKDAAWDAAWRAARGAAWDAAWDASHDAARDAAWRAARGAAWNAAWNAAWDAARRAARGATWRAAWDASLYARYIGIVADLTFKDKEKNLKHIEARWEVWQKGYGLLCDVNGILYVYAVKPNKPLTTQALVKITKLKASIAEKQREIGKQEAELKALEG